MGADNDSAGLMRLHGNFDVGAYFVAHVGDRPRLGNHVDVLDIEMLAPEISHGLLNPSIDAAYGRRKGILLAGFIAVLHGSLS
jgi:hypothetical protein